MHVCMYVCLYEYSKEYWKKVLEKQSNWKKQRPTNLPQRDSDNWANVALQHVKLSSGCAVCSRLHAFISHHPFGSAFGAEAIFQLFLFLSETAQPYFYKEL